MIRWLKYLIAPREMAELERYKELCAAAYQMAGTVNAPVRFLDALSDGACGELEARAKTEDLLPVDPTETGCFPAWCVDVSDDELFDMAEPLLERYELADGRHVHAAAHTAVVAGMQAAIELARAKEKS